MSSLYDRSESGRADQRLLMMFLYGVLRLKGRGPLTYAQLVEALQEEGLTFPRLGFAPGQLWHGRRRLADWIDRLVEAGVLVKSRGLYSLCDDGQALDDALNGRLLRRRRSRKGG